jgi:Zn-dependent M28 family amino/carboxypeptidase
VRFPGFAVLAVIGVALAVVASSGAATSDTEVLRTPFTDFQENPCFSPVGELVEASGILHVVKHTTQTPNGASHVYSASFTGVNGVGLLSGDRYVESYSENQSDYMSSKVMPSEFTHTETIVLNRLGEDGTRTKDDFLFHSEAHGTVSASGVVTLKSLEFKPECR